ncbi:transposase, partial [Aquimarina intermedia]|uniref:transposase n=1 Tax=Aquimarina intermedia TaxID=350814 RepID=UPI001B86AEFE
RRFCLHILPKGFTRIRHYGILSSSIKNKVLPILKGLLTEKPAIKNKHPIQHRRCPNCKKGILVTVHTFGSRGPPNHWLKMIKSKHTAPKSNTLVV